MITKDRQYRSFDFNDKGEMRIEGVPIVFNQPTEMYEIDGLKFYEVIDNRALDQAKMDEFVDYL